MLDSTALEQLITRVAARDQSALKQLYDATASKLFAVALRVTNRQGLAEEVLQEVFVSVWNQAENYRAAMSAPMTWMTTLTRYKAIDVVRAQDPEVSLRSRDDDDDSEPAENQIADESPTPMQLLLHAETTLAVKDCLGSLEVGPRQSIALGYYNGLTQQQIAEQLAQPLGTVKAWMRRGLERLQKCLDDRYELRTA
jgi:RNA polymerase sigma-70 factor, ECF subfamily